MCPPRKTQATTRPSTPTARRDGRSSTPSVLQNSQGIQIAALVTGNSSQTTSNRQSGNARPANHRPQAPTPQRPAKKNIPSPATQSRALGLGSLGPVVRRPGVPVLRVPRRLAALPGDECCDLDALAVL